MDELETRADTAPSALENAADRERREKLEALIWETPEKFRVPLFLHYFDGMTKKGIAEILELSISTVSYRLDKGLDLIRPKAAKMGMKDLLGGL
ncbi:MAG: RNA polymerase sigma factor, partial [Oceanicaulis sp.]